MQFSGLRSRWTPSRAFLGPVYSVSILALSSMGTQAGEITFEVITQPAEANVRIHFLSAARGDFNENSNADYVLLARTPGDRSTANLLILEDVIEGAPQRILKLENLFTSLSVGEVNAVSETSFSVTYGNIGVGRSRWVSELKVAFRDDEYLVSGYSINAWDAFDLEKSISCDVNLLTGEYEKSRGSGNRIVEKGTIDLERIRLSELPEVSGFEYGFAPAICR